jgi:hypothetical protein
MKASYVEIVSDDTPWLSIGVGILLAHDVHQVVCVKV